MYDYLYDFGFLGEKEEESYVKAMVQPVFNPNLVTGADRGWCACVCELILFSQQFTSEHQPDCLLSLRDVKRTVELIRWFQEGLAMHNAHIHTLHYHAFGHDMKGR